MFVLAHSAAKVRGGRKSNESDPCRWLPSNVDPMDMVAVFEARCQECLQNLFGWEVKTVDCF